jgi:hypothetical protein
MIENGYTGALSNRAGHGSPFIQPSNGRHGRDASEAKP